MQRAQSLTVGLMIMVGAVATAPAAPASRPISMEECLKLALEHNFDIRISRLGPRVAQLNLDNAYAPYDPTVNSSFSYSYNSSPTGVDAQGRPYTSTVNTSDTFANYVSGQGPLGLTYRTGLQMSDTVTTRSLVTPFEISSAFAGVSLTQPLMKNFWIDNNRLSIALRRRDLKSSEQDLRLTVISIVSSVQSAYYKLIALQDSVKVAQQALELAEQQLREDNKRVQVGSLAPLDAQKTESQVATMRGNLLSALAAAATGQRDLKRLISDRYDDWKNFDLQPTEKLSKAPPVLNLQDSWSKALTLRPELIKTRLDLERRNITLRYNKNQLYPELDLTGSFGYSGSGNEFSDALGGINSQRDASYSFGAQLTFPLSRREVRTNYRLARENVEQALLVLKQLEQKVMIDTEDALGAANTAFLQIKEREIAVVTAEAALHAERKKQENGRSTNREVLIAQNELTTRRYDLIFALVSYNAALVTVAQYEGTTLERNGIRLEVR